MRRTRLGRVPLMVITGVLAVLISACAGSGASGGTTGGGPEKTHITVGALPVPDSAPLYIAIRRGFFKQQGLTVTPEVIGATAQSTPKLLAGTMDFSLLNYVSTFEIQESGVPFRVVADAIQSSANYFVIMVPKGSPIKSPADLKGKTIAVPAPNAIGTLGVDSVVKPYGITQNQMKFVSIPFPNMQAAFETHQIDAATVVEPFVTQMKAAIGAQQLADMMTGPMVNFPIVGWGTVQNYVQKHPKTVAAFQRAMAKAQQVAATDRSAVEQVLPTYTKIPPQVAKVMALGTYPTTLSATRLQRVSDLMFEFSLLHKRLNVASMVLPEPAS